MRDLRLVKELAKSKGITLCYKDDKKQMHKLSSINFDGFYLRTVLTDGERPTIDNGMYDIYIDTWYNDPKNGNTNDDRLIGKVKIVNNKIDLEALFLQLHLNENDFHRFFEGVWWNEYTNRYEVSMGS